MEYNYAIELLNKEEIRLMKEQINLMQMRDDLYKERAEELINNIESLRTSARLLKPNSLTSKLIKNFKVDSFNLTQMATTILYGTGWSLGKVDEEFDLRYRSFESSGSNVMQTLYNIADKFNATVSLDGINQKVNFLKEKEINLDKYKWDTVSEESVKVSEILNNEWNKNKGEVAISGNLTVTPMNVTTTIDMINHKWDKTQVDEVSKVLNKMWKQYKSTNSSEKTMTKDEALKYLKEYNESVKPEHAITRLRYNDGRDYVQDLSFYTHPAYMSEELLEALKNGQTLTDDLEKEFSKFIIEKSI